MTTVATAVVKLAADIGDFDKGLVKAQKQLLKTADAMESWGKKLSLGFTAPLIAASAALAKSAAEDAASVAKLSRAFGSGAAAMESFIGQMMKVTPATDDQLRQIVANTQAFNLSLGMTPAKAQAMTQSITKLAADLAAYNHVELSTASDAITSAMAGKTKALKTMNVVVTEAEIKARGLSAIEQHMTVMRGEAARTIGEDANAWARFQQSMDSASDSMGQAVLPTFAKILNVAGNLAKRIAELDSGTKGFIVTVGVLVASIGPLLMLAGSVTKAWVAFNAVTLALAAPGGGLALLAALVSPAGIVVAGLAMIGTMLYASGESARKAKVDLDEYAAALLKLPSASKAALEQQRNALQAMKSSIVAQQGNVKTQLDGISPWMPSVKRMNLVAKSDMLSGQLDRVQGPLDATNAALKMMETTSGGVVTNVESLKGISPFDAMLAQMHQMTEYSERMMENITGLERVVPKYDFKPAAPLVDRQRRDEIRAGMLGDTGLSNIFSSGSTLPGLGGTPRPRTPDPKPELSKMTQALTTGFATVAVAIGDTLAQNLANIFGGGRGAQIGGSIFGAAGGAAAGQLLGKGAGAVLGSVVPVIGTIAGTIIGGAIGSLFDHKRSVDRNTEALHRLAEVMNAPSGFKVDAARYRATRALEYDMSQRGGVAFA